MEDDHDLYGDLDEKADKQELDDLKVKHAALEKTHASVEIDLEETKKQMLKLIEDKDTLENNLVKVFNTAMQDLKRKDSQIIELQLAMNKLRSGQGR